VSSRDAPRSSLPHLLDIDAVAEHLGVTVRHVRRLVAERRIPFLKWGHLLRFDPDEIADWLESTRVRPEPASPLPITHRRYVRSRPAGTGLRRHRTPPAGRVPRR
jgi:excisionase family DNA binding protein